MSAEAFAPAGATTPLAARAGAGAGSQQPQPQPHKRATLAVPEDLEGLVDDDDVRVVEEAQVREGGLR